MLPVAGCCLVTNYSLILYLLLTLFTVIDYSLNMFLYLLWETQKRSPEEKVLITFKVGQ